MLKRKIERENEQYLSSPSNKILLIDGARQIGKTYIVRHVGRKMYPNYVNSIISFLLALHLT